VRSVIVVKAIETESERRARERANLVAALERSGGKVYGSDGAAELLGVPSTTLASRLRALGIRRSRRGRRDGMRPRRALPGTIDADG
jgi:formate hydrogenlyase transcriptional activator